MRSLLSRTIDTSFFGRHAIRTSLLIGAVLFVLEVAFLFLAAWADDNFSLEGKGIGLLEHPGIWAILIGDLFVLLLIAYLVKSFLLLDKKLPVTGNKKAARYIKYCKYKTLRAIRIQANSSTLYYAMGVGALFWLNNAIQTWAPYKYYGNDVFDSILHINSYIVFRLILGTSWIVLYPICAYISVLVGVTLFKLLKRLKAHYWLDFDIYHPDKCGGFSYLGNINIAFITTIFVIYFELTVVLLTHDKLNPGLASGFVIISIAFVVVTYAILYPALKYLKEKKSVLLMRFYKNLKKQPSCHQMLDYQWVNNSLSFSPYSHYQTALLNLARLSPIVTIAIKLKLLG